MISTDTSFRTSVTVQAPIERAFTVFTEGFDSWWPKSHHIGTAEMAAAVLEPRAGGRWHERGTDGSECEWGRVLVWDPPHHVAMSWHLNGAWAYDPDPEKASRVDVRFLADGDGTTRVELEHSGLDRHGSNWTAVRDGISSEGGWSALLAGFGLALSGSSDSA
jgi:uncharacterized protein YndB with AHSA1/START domain